MVNEERVRELQQKAVIVRGHADVYEMVQRKANGENSPILNAWLPRLRDAGVNVVFLAISGDSPAHRNGDMRYLHGAMKILDQILEENENHPEIKVIRSKEDLPAEADNDLHLLLTLEGGLPLEGSLANLRNFYRLGIRLLQPTHNLRNELADGGAEEGVGGGGLTRFGIDVIKEANKLGILIDLAHLTERGFWHVLEVSEKPVVVTHADSKTICGHRRNLTDEQIKAIAEQGGTVGVLALPNYLAEGFPTMDVLFRHVDHMLSLVGPKHVSIGHLGLDKELADTFSDVTYGPYANYRKLTRGFNGGVNDKERFHDFIEGLVKMGLSDEDVSNMLGGNYLRILKQVL